MLADSRFTVKDAEGNVIGVRNICPWCESNRYTKTGRAWSTVVRLEMETVRAAMSSVLVRVPRRVPETLSSVL